MIRIEVIFDTICPWCFVGTRRLARALRMRPHVDVQTVFRPFLLNPDMPEEGMPRDLYLERKFGSRARIDRMLTAVAAAGESEGIDFDFDAIDRTPNTLRSHRMVAFAGQFGRQQDIVEALFQAYFLEGKDIGSIEELITLGARLGLPELELAKAIRSWPPSGMVPSENARAHRMGVNGVPCYIVEESYAVAGAQEPDVLVRLIDLAHEAQPVPAISSV